MLEKFSFMKIDQKDVDSKLSGLFLTTAMSVAGMVGLFIVAAILVDDEDEDEDKDDSGE